MPASQFTTRYAFPWYNNKDLDTQLQVGNLGNASTQVRVFIGGVEMKTGCTSLPAKPYPYTLAKGTSLRVSCAGVNKGPLKVIGSTGVPIVVSLRLHPKNSTASFSEVMGFPLNRLTTRYIFPWYDNKELNTQLRLAVP